MVVRGSSSGIRQAGKSNKPLKAQQLKLLGPTLRRSFCALIAQNNQHSSGPLAERYTSINLRNISNENKGIISFNFISIFSFFVC